jgi:hypothetical protein
MLVEPALLEAIVLASTGGGEDSSHGARCPARS